MPFGRKSAPREYDEASLLEASLRLLESKMRSSAELRRALKRKVGAQPEGPALIEATIAKLRAMRLLDDERYAAAYTSYRKTNERFGRQRVRQDLMVKGVDKTTIDKTLAEAFDDEDEVSLAKGFLRRKRAKAPKDQKEAARLFRMLARAGYSGRASAEALRELKVDEETLGELELAREEADLQEGEAE